MSHSNEMIGGDEPNPASDADRARALSVIATRKPTGAAFAKALSQKEQDKKDAAEHKAKVKEAKGRLKATINKLGQKLPGFRREMKQHRSSLGKDQLSEDLRHLENMEAFGEKQSLDLNERYNPDYPVPRNPSDNSRQPYRDAKCDALFAQYHSAKKSLVTQVTSTNSALASILKKDFKINRGEPEAPVDAFVEESKKVEASFELFKTYRELLAAQECLKLYATDPPKQLTEEQKKLISEFEDLPTPPNDLEKMQTLLKDMRAQIDVLMPRQAVTIVQAPAAIKFKPDQKSDGNSQKFKDLQKEEALASVFKERKKWIGGPKWTSHSHKAGQAEDDRNNYNHLTYSSRHKNRAFHFEAKADHLSASASRKELSAAKKDWDQCPQPARVKAINVMMRTYLMTTDLMAERLRQLESIPGSGITRPTDGHAYNITLTPTKSDPPNPAFDKANQQICDAYQYLMAAHLGTQHSDREKLPFLINNEKPAATLLIKGKDILIEDLKLTEKEFDHINQQILAQAKKQKAICHTAANPNDKPQKGQKDQAKENYEKAKKRKADDAKSVKELINETVPKKRSKR